MTENELRDRIKEGRDFCRPYEENDNAFLTDQEQHIPQPPLFKAPMSETYIELPLSFDTLNIDHDFLQIVNSRKSERLYTQEDMPLAELSYLLWCSQGVKQIRGKNYATVRTVPSGGARHPFEVYMTIQSVEGLKDGFYHYLPAKHAVEFLKGPDDMDSFITASLDGQKWAARANVVFYYSFVCYRAEWRYSYFAHRIVMADAGHVTESLYLAATSIGCGGCAIGAVNGKMCDQTFGLDGTEEFIFYAMPVGKIREKEDTSEDPFAFIKAERASTAGKRKCE